MTPTQYLSQSGACTSAELIAYAKTDKAGFETLKTWAAEEMKAKGIEITESTKK